MPRTIIRLLLAVILVCSVAGLVAGGFALAQDEERSRFVRFVERQLSTEDRQIRLGRIDGALSSDVRISEITIADRRGVWLRLEGAELVWSRLALLRGRLSIEKLTADRIEILRKPLPAESDEPLEASNEPFTLPNLPVSIRIDEFSIGEVDIAQGVIGPAARLQVAGNARLADGDLESKLDITRLDREGSLTLDASFGSQSRQLAIDFVVSEPADGVIANALQIEGRPPIRFEIDGSGPLSDFSANITLDADGQTLVSGVTRIVGQDGGLRFISDISGDLTPLVADLYDPLVEGGSEIAFDATRAADGTITIDEGALKSGVAALTFSGALAADFVPTRLSINGDLQRADNEPVVLPASAGDATVRSARIDVSLGQSADGEFSANIVLNDLESPFVATPQASLSARGTAQNLSDPATRSVTFTVAGRAQDVASDKGGVADAIGGALRLDIAGAWSGGSPVAIETATLETETTSARFSGTIGEALNGTYALNAPDLSAFAALVDRPLSGAVDFTAQGEVGFAGLFNLTLDAAIQNLSLGIEAVDGLLEGRTSIAGRAARTEDGVSFQNFSAQNPQISLTADGAVLPDTADLRASVELANLNAVAPDLSGTVSAELQVSGNPANPTIGARVTSPQIDLRGESLTGLETRFDGTFTRDSEMPADLDGDLTLRANLAGEPISLSARLESADGARILRNLSARIVDASVTGTVALRDGLASGDVSVDVPDLRRLAALALVEATGAINADIALRTPNETQDITVTGTARGVEVEGTAQLGFADIALSVNDLFGVPILDGKVEVRALEAAGFTVRTLDLTAQREGDNATDIALNADLGRGTLDATGRLERVTEGFAATLRTFRLAGEGRTAVLQNPARVTVTDQITIDGANLAVGDGSVSVSGTLGETLDLSAEIDALSLDIANLVRDGLGVDGTLDGTLSLSGTRAEPVAQASVRANNVTAAILRERGIDPIDLTGEARYADGTARIEMLRANVGGGTVTAEGVAGETFDLNVNVADLPLALANAFAPDLGLRGTVSGEAEVMGTLEDPSATFSVRADAVSATVLSGAGVDPFDVVAQGRYADGTATLSEARARIAGGTIVASGTAGDRLDLEVRLEALPLAVANAFQPGLGLDGQLSGVVSVTGRPSRPEVTFRLESPAVSAAATRAAGLGAGSLRAAGRFEGSSVDLAEATLSIGGGSLRASGTVGQRLNVRADLTNLPLALANAASPGLGLSGSLSGTVSASGSLAAPAATFDLSARNVSADPLANAGLSGINVDASGRFDGNTVTLSSVTASGGGLDARVSGAVPLSGGGLSLSVNARAPLSLANRFLAERGATIDGTANIDARVTGSLSAPQVSGSVSASGITFRDPQTNLVLTGGSLDANLAGDRVVIRSLSAGLGGGTVSVTGSIGLSGGFPADLDLALRSARYADGQLFAATLDGDLSITGPLATSPLIAGNVLIDRAEISVPESFAGSGALIDVHHIAAPAAVLETLRRAKVGPFAETTDSGGTRATGVRLDIAIDAPARIFVRGRGIDAELGGQVRLTGPVSAISPVGRFELIRGRLVILGQRIVFSEGSVTLLGDLDPTIRFVAETRNNQVTVRVIIDGPASDPDVRFESDPELPQDEVLAQLLFGRSIADLSAFQIAQLAAAVAELAGAGGGPGILEQIRVFAGLDNLEIVTDEDGGTAVEAGRYIADNIYLGVRAGDEGAGVTVNLDVTRDIKVRAEALSNETSIGVFFEKDY